jgi:hypothetical protein
VGILRLTDVFKETFQTMESHKTQWNSNLCALSYHFVNTALNSFFWCLVLPIDKCSLPLS